MPERDVHPDGDAVRSARRRLGWTQESLAERVGVHKKTIENLEAGRSARLRTIVDVAEALGTTFDSLALQVEHRFQEASSIDLFFRIEADLTSDADPQSGGKEHIVIDAGFSRVLLKSPDDFRTPVVCGCSSARLCLEIKGGNCSKPPEVSSVPDGSKSRVEFGAGPRPAVRFDSADLGESFLDGWAQARFPIGRDPGGEGLVVVVTLRAEWFSVQPPGCAADDLGPSQRILADVMMTKFVGSELRREYRF